MASRRSALLRQARGTVLEIGAGTGLNLAAYPPVDRLVLTEPAPTMREILDRRAARRPGTTVLDAGAEALPVASGSIDTVVSTLVLCTVDNVPATLAEIARVLRPGGRLLFAEHVRSDDPKLARWQDRLEGPWKFLGHGCRCNRDTLAAIGSSPLEVEAVEHEALPKAAPIVRPLIVGSAVRPA
jgi:SAM-dependent methyltransferase